MEPVRKRNNRFSGHLGFVLAAAGSAVGLGNIWRFPYLAAKDGGGLFLVLYLALLVTFGFAFLSTDLCIGRRTKLSSIQAYKSMRPGWGFLGYLAFLIPAIILTYYTVIGGWILKYVAVYLTGAGKAAATDGYFGQFITSPVAPLVFMLLFLALTAWIVYNGVNKGIERSSVFIMPILVLIVIGIGGFALTLTHTDAAGITRTGMEGLRIYLVPNFDGITLSRFMHIIMDALNQLFFSMSIAMGIMITYGSYVKDEVNLQQSIAHIGIFDTGVAVLAGLMVIPAIYAFNGPEGMSAGPGLIFVALPKIFHAMGDTGVAIGLIFFIMTTFAALTSCISIMEALVANCLDMFHASRRRITLIITAVYAVLSSIICLGYYEKAFYVEMKLPNGSTGQLLDLMDYISNYLFMPLLALFTAILVGWIMKPAWIVEELEKGGNTFRFKAVYAFMIRYICPALMVILLLQAVGILK